MKEVERLLMRMEKEERKMLGGRWDYEQVGTGQADGDDAWQLLLSTTSLMAGAPSRPSF